MSDANPTAPQCPGLEQETDVSEPPNSDGFGLGVTFQRVPSQVSISVVRSARRPTATHCVTLGHEIPDNTLPCAEGVCANDHRVPFHFSINAPGADGWPICPTAKHVVSLAHATAESHARLPGFGVASTVHARGDELALAFALATGSIPAISAAHATAIPPVRRPTVAPPS
jgi:hypothetical protein